MNQTWIRPKLRVADNPTRPINDIKKRKQELRNEGKLPAGTPDPDTQDGRDRMIHKLEVSVGDVELRARLMKSLITKALAAKNRQDFKEQLILMTDQVTQLKMHDVPDVVDTLLSTIKLYEKSQGRDLNLKEFRESEPDSKDASAHPMLSKSAVWTAYVIR